MYCPHCGKEIKDGNQFCSFCGSKIVLPRSHCPNCGASIDENTQECLACGYHLALERMKPIVYKSKVVAIFLGIVLGGLGAHNFYLGYSSKGFIQIVLFFMGILTFGLTTFISVVWGIVDVLLIVTGLIERDGDDNLLH